MLARSLYNRSMLRRLVLIFMMLAIPFQVTWAAAGVFCEHESGAAARHFGHHDHAHKSIGTEQSDVKGKFDPDCSFHSHAGCQGIPAQEATISLVEEVATFSPTALHFPTNAVFYRPDRPKWAATV